MPDHIEDPLAMYLVVRESLNMSSGKCCAQTSHSVQGILLKYFKIQVLTASKKNDIIPEDLKEKARLTTDWLEHGSRKIVLKASDSEFEKIKEMFKDCVVIKDNGLTEVEKGSETAICLWPMHKSSAPREIRKLSALK